ncbi:hypothetical protein TNCV_2665971 [Trichonephila clavipes]|nr:hypothetical protein TNCV_2665971 [Trichonephila clavipes]
MVSDQVNVDAMRCKINVRPFAANPLLVTTQWTDISVLVRMPWSKIHRWRLLVTRTDRRSVVSVQRSRSVSHSGITFELPSVRAVPKALRFCVSVAHFTISWGRRVSRCHLPSLTPAASIVCLHQ